MQEATNQGGKESDLFSRAGLDHPNQLERPREIGFFARAISAAQRAQRGRRGPENSTDLPVGQLVSETWGLRTPLAPSADFG